MTNSTTVRGSGGRRPLLTPWRREALRTTLWVVPTAMVAAAILLFGVTYGLDRAIANGRMSLPGWAIAGEADASRQVLIGIAAAVITVAGVVFSITILALQLASQQFGPRMLRNFIRDRGTQASLGAFVATFGYSVLTLGSVARQSSSFVPHITVTEALTREHIVGSNRTLTQDPGFAVDQLVEVAIRALSPAVNDTFTALNCIDWLGDCLCRVARDPLPDGIYRDADGAVRLVDRVVTFERLVKGAPDKIRQAGP